MKDIGFTITAVNNSVSKVIVHYGGRAIIQQNVIDGDVPAFKALAFALQAEMLKDIIKMILPPTPAAPTQPSTQSP